MIKQPDGSFVSDAMDSGGVNVLERTGRFNSLAGTGLGATVLGGGALIGAGLTEDQLMAAETQNIASPDPYETFTETSDDLIADMLGGVISDRFERQRAAENLNMILGSTGILGGVQMGSDIGIGARWLQDQYGDKIKRFFYDPNPGIDWSEHEQ